MSDAAAGTGTGTGAGTGTGTGAGAGTGAAAPAWHGYDAAANKDDVAYVANKGWSGAQDVIKSYRSAETLIGRDPSTLLVLPRADDPQGFLSAMDRLGRPAAPDKYEFDKAPAGVEHNQDYLAWSRGAFHKIGLTAGQAKALVNEHTNYVKAAAEQQEKDYQLAVQSDKKALIAEWRGGAERMFNAASSAAKMLGFSPELIDAMERANGYAKTMKFFAELGQKLGDDTFVGAQDKRGSFSDAMTPEEAKAEWGRMQSDPALKAALTDKSHPRHAEAQEKQNKLFAVMYPEG